MRLFCDLPLDSRLNSSPPGSRRDHPASCSRTRSEVFDGSNLRTFPLASSSPTPLRTIWRKASASPISAAAPDGASRALVNVQIQLERILWRVQLSARELELQPEAFQATEESFTVPPSWASVIGQIENRSATQSSTSKSR